MDHGNIVPRLLIQVASADASGRDAAVEALGDILEYRSVGVELLQDIVDGLGRALEKETDARVIESILNAMSHAKDNDCNLQLPAGTIRKRFSTLTGSAKEHAKYILEDT